MSEYEGQRQQVLMHKKKLAIAVAEQNFLQLISKKTATAQLLCTGHHQCHTTTTTMRTTQHKICDIETDICSQTVQAKPDIPSCCPTSIQTEPIVS
jgi:hypothetical protein